MKRLLFALLFLAGTARADLISSSNAGGSGGGGGGNPGGSSQQVQFNNSGTFGGASNFTYNGTSVTVNNGLNVNAISPFISTGSVSFVGTSQSSATNTGQWAFVSGFNQGTGAPYPEMSLANPNDQTCSTSDYCNETHLRFMAGTNTNHREYLNFWNPASQQDDWVAGRNACSAYITYDAGFGEHRIWMESTVVPSTTTCTNTGNSYFNSEGTGGVWLNYHPSDTTGTGGLRVYGGGPPASNPLLLTMNTTNYQLFEPEVIISTANGAPQEMDITTTTISVRPQNFIFSNGSDTNLSGGAFKLNTGVSSAVDNLFDFESKGSDKFYLGFKSNGDFRLYDVAGTSYIFNYDEATKGFGIGRGNTSSGVTLSVEDATASTGQTQLLIQGGANPGDVSTNTLVRVNAGGGTTQTFGVTGDGTVTVSSSVIISTGIASVPTASRGLLTLAEDGTGSPFIGISFVKSATGAQSAFIRKVAGGNFFVEDLDTTTSLILATNSAARETIASNGAVTFSVGVIDSGFLNANSSVTIVSPGTNLFEMTAGTTTAGSAYHVAISTNGHILSQGATPAISACGSTPNGSVVGNDHAGIITVGGGSVTGCTLTFAQSYGAACTVVCTISDSITTATPDVTSTATAMTMAFSATIGGGSVAYHCEGVGVCQ